MIRIFGEIKKSPSFPAFVLFIILFILNCFITKGFTSHSFINSFFASNVPLICIAIGSAGVIISGGIDLSVGAIITLINVVMISLFGAGWGIAPVILVSLLLAAGMGALNGLMVGILRVNPLMATFASQSIFAGIALWIMSIPGGSSPVALAKWYNGNLFGIPASLIVMLIVLAASIVLLKSRIGIKLYAIGNNEEKAFVSGVNVSRIKFMVYTFSGIASGVAAIALTARIGGGDPTVALPMTLTCIAACVIGGLDLAGGKGTSVGGIWGAMFLQLIITTIFSTGVSTFRQDLVKGLIIFAGIAGTIIVSNSKRRSKSAGLQANMLERGKQL